MAKDTLTVTDNRTGRSCRIPVGHAAIGAADLRPLGLVSYDPAFANTAACTSRITYIDGDTGVLLYRGYPIEQLAEQSTFLETAYLLIKGELPSAERLAQWTHNITMHTIVHENVKQFMDGFRYDAHPMGMLVATVGALSTFYPDAQRIHDPESRRGGRGRAANVGGDRVGRARAGVPEAREGGRGAARGLRPPRLPHLRSAREGAQAPRPAGVRDHRAQPPPGRRPRARAHRARGRLLRRTQALSQRGLLLGHHLPGDGLPGGDVPGAVRHRAHRGLDRAVARDGAGRGADNRPPPPALPAPRPARLRAAGGACRRCGRRTSRRTPSARGPAL